MNYLSYYSSPLGKMALLSDREKLTAILFCGQRFYNERMECEHEEKDLPVFTRTKEWLDIYFTGKNPKFTPPVSLYGTPFQLSVWNLITNIPYGETVTYGELAQKIASANGISKMSARAVGAAVGRNPISIIIPCHRVIGSNGNLTGYSGGIDKKLKLLQLEQANVTHMPTL
jgi:methylated-DNA-[protein]-cysteine S-methyltransferase